MKTKKRYIIQIVLLSLAFILVCALLLALFNFSLDKSENKNDPEQSDTEPTTLYLVVDGQEAADGYTADLSNDLELVIVSDVDDYDYSIRTCDSIVCESLYDQYEWFMFSVDTASYIFVGGGNDSTAAFTIVANGKNLKVSATTISQVLTKYYNSSTFSYEERSPVENFPYFVLEITCGTKTISVLLTMPS